MASSGVLLPLPRAVPLSGRAPLPVHTGHLSLLTGLAQQRRSPARSALTAHGPLHRTLTPLVILQLFCDYLSNVSPTSRTAGSRRARTVCFPHHGHPSQHPSQAPVWAPARGEWTTPVLGAPPTSSRYLV